MKTVNIFKVLSSYDGTINEPNISSFLAYLLDPSKDHGLKNVLLKRFLSPLLLRYKDYYYELLNDQDELAISDYTVSVQAEVTVKHGKGSRDIDILVELFNKKTNELAYSFCIENKIRDNSIKDDNQLIEEVEGLWNHYKKADLTPNIGLIFLTLAKTSKAENEFNKANEALKNNADLRSSKCFHLTWKPDKDKDSTDTVSILKGILADEATGSIDPIYEYMKHTIKAFISFIENDFLSNDLDERSVKYSFDYFKEVYDELNKDKEYTLNHVKNLVHYKMVVAKYFISMETLNRNLFSVIVNEPKRQNYKEAKDSKRDLFYYTDESQKDKIKKYKPAIQVSIFRP